MTRPTPAGGWVCLSSPRKWSISRTSSTSAEVSVSPARGREAAAPRWEGSVCFTEAVRRASHLQCDTYVTASACSWQMLSLVSSCCFFCVLYCTWMPLVGQNFLIFRGSVNPHCPAPCSFLCCPGLLKAFQVATCAKNWRKEERKGRREEKVPLWLSL